MNAGERDLAAEALADGCAEHAARWAAASGAPAEAVAVARHAARCASRAVSDGHVCARLADVAASHAPPLAVEALRAALLASGIAGTPQAPGVLPFVVDDERLYLHRYYDHERRLARRLFEASGPAVAPPPAARALLRELFPRRGGVDWQQVAAALALRGRLAVISGGPGTGKTTTVVKLLACLLAAEPGARVALAAPTGKAAARMLDALRARAGDLPAALRAALPTEATTVHRLLGATPDGRFRHDARHPLAIDALVVDEASMLDLALAARLFDALPPGARIVLLGDKDQLAAVESGAVFAELSADPALSPGCAAALAELCGGVPAEAIRPPPADAAGLADSVVWLRENHRFDASSAIGRAAAAVNAGDAAATEACLRAPGDASLRWIDDGAARPERAALDAIEAGYAPYFDALRATPHDRAAVFAAFERFRVLCAVREGPRGVDAVNALIEGRLRRTLEVAASASPWLAGRPVIVLRNDPVQKLYNGDVGIALPADDGRLLVWFADRDAGLRGIAPARLPRHETAFATTVHKAQGSEFDTALLLLPSQPSRVVTRELLYTAVTRAKSQAIVVASADAVVRAVATPTLRHSGLAARLRELHAARDTAR